MTKYKKRERNTLSRDEKRRSERSTFDRKRGNKRDTKTYTVFNF